jgi:dTDP-glucose 4,6-dehydratase
VLFILKNLPPHAHVAGEADKPDRYNITGDKQVDNLELVHVIAKLMNADPKIEIVDHHSTRPGHDKHYGLNGDKLKNLGWTSPMSFEESLKNTIEWQKNNPEWII